MILGDPTLTVHDLTEAETARLLAIAQADFHAAEESRREREDRALEDLATYLRTEREVEASRKERKGWSKIRVPLVFWLVETMLPRIGVTPPTITATAKNPESVAYAQAKQLRLQHYLEQGGWERQALMVAKQMLVLGDGPAKVPFDTDAGIPRFLHLPWWDFFMSHEASDWETAEVYFHRTWLTKRQVERMAGAEDPEGRPLYANLADAVTRSATREEADDTWAQRRDAAGYGARSSESAGPMIPFVECWYQDGSYITLAGADEATVVRAGVSPFKDAKGRPVRPFVLFGGTPDLQGPYSISLSQVLGDHQVELETMRNQWIDQMTGNINAGVVHAADIPGQDVEEFLAAPNGRLSVKGYQDVRGAVMRMPPGQVSGDFPLLYEQLRSEAQMISGVSDISAGQSSAAGLDNQTATGISIIAAESNKRIQLFLRLHEIAMGKVAKLFDCHDRQFGKPMMVEVEPGFAPEEGAMGIAPPASAPGPDGAVILGQGGGGAGYAGRFANVGIGPNAPGMEFDITVDAGSTARPDQLEEAQKMQAFVSIAASIPPIAERMDWDEITRRMIQVHGLSPDRMMMTPEQRQAEAFAQQMAAMGVAPGGPQTNGRVPVGPPVPVG